jgi:hypothetical protein
MASSMSKSAAKSAAKLATKPVVLDDSDDDESDDDDSDDSSASKPRAARKPSGAPQPGGSQVSAKAAPPSRSFPPVAGTSVRPIATKASNKTAVAAGSSSTSAAAKAGVPRPSSAAASKGKDTAVGPRSAFVVAKPKGGAVSAKTDSKMKKKKAVRAWSTVHCMIPSGVPIVERVCAQFGLKATSNPAAAKVVIPASQAELQALLESSKSGSRHFFKLVGGAFACTKLGLSRQMNRCKRLLPDEYSFWPDTWLLPEQFAAFERHWARHGSGRTFIAKPEYGRHNCVALSVHATQF